MTLLCVYINIFIYFIYIKVKLVTIVTGDPKAPLSIATTPRCRGGGYSFFWIALLYFLSLPYSAES